MVEGNEHISIGLNNSYAQYNGDVISSLHTATYQNIWSCLGFPTVLCQLHCIWMPLNCVRTHEAFVNVVHSNLHLLNDSRTQIFIEALHKTVNIWRSQMLRCWYYAFTSQLWKEIVGHFTFWIILWIIS